MFDYLHLQTCKQCLGQVAYFITVHCRASGGMAIFLGVSAAPKRILLSKISYAPVQHSLSQPESFIVCCLNELSPLHSFAG